MDAVQWEIAEDMLDLARFNIRFIQKRSRLVVMTAAERSLIIGEFLNDDGSVRITTVGIAFCSETDEDFSARFHRSLSLGGLRRHRG